MIVQDLTHLQIDDFLARASYGRIACESEGQPYIACVSLCAESCFLYGFALSGQKIRLMRANPRVCVEFDEIKSVRDWTTVIVTGVYEELTDTPQYRAEREHAYALLKRRAMWWEPAAAERQPQAGPAANVYFRIRMDRMTGRRGASDTPGG
ncbi:MAG TPA: pyridoxamine 5'-phosphate oxidase family protein [Rhizomicrobium sp.]|nr:pyridoxamine 5'-phosphate oxidase family protein [Rhizomicrobium sp.]